MVPQSIIFLDFGKILRIHNELIAHYGGSHGIRDSELLKSAVEMPVASFDGRYLHQNIFEMAAAYMYHITQNHPFIDGNKRVGAASAIIFLSINDIEIENDQDGLIELSLKVASGKAYKEQIADFFRKNAIR
ncbi:MAG: type II toxin-antitoxin system death-on-curing family toxin [Sedimentisphaeraceae bacterium JB056]